MTKILLDTDIGTDVDDAVCLAYLLSQPACELLGITTVTGQANQRAALSSALCQAASRHIPIYPGAEQPMTGSQRQPVAQQAAALSRWPHQTSFPQGQSIQFLNETIRSHPGEVILLTIGPLTNIGQLFSVHPDLPALLKGMVLMGGAYTEDISRQEWNISADPLAAQVVFNAPLPELRAVGLNVTLQVRLSADEVRQRFTATLLRPVLDFAEIWFAQSHPQIIFHDPLAAAVIFDETLCTFHPGKVDINLQDTPGKTYWQAGCSPAPHLAAFEVDVERYFEHFFGVF